MCPALVEQLTLFFIRQCLQSFLDPPLRPVAPDYMGQPCNHHGDFRRRGFPKRDAIPISQKGTERIIGLFPPTHLFYRVPPYSAFEKRLDEIIIGHATRRR